VKFLQKLLQVVAYLPALITGVEPLFGSGNGNQKKDAVLGLVGTLLNFAESISAKDIVDQDAFNDGLKKAIDGIVQVLNASVWAKKGA
jgi:hypothetical protein